MRMISLEKEKFTFDYEIVIMLRQLVEKFNKEGLEVDTTYLDYFGDECPNCKTKFKVYKNSVKNIGSISSYILLEKNKSVIYALCRDCARKLNTGIYGKKNYEEIETFIASKLPELKRTHFNKDTEKELIQEEYNILDKIDS